MFDVECWCLSYPRSCLLIARDRTPVVSRNADLNCTTKVTDPSPPLPTAVSFPCVVSLTNQPGGAGDVGIDGLYGPSEVVIVADETANPAYCAADLLAQAEHGSGASAIMITDSRQLANDVNREIGEQLKTLARREIVGESLEGRGFIAVVPSTEEAIDLANLYAPEHLLMLVEGAESYLEKITAAGCVITGKKGTVALGDYIAGPSHILPTGGTARFGSPLNVTDFVKITSLIDTDKFDISEIGKATQVFAETEGLDAHAKAIEKRLE